MCRLHLHCVGFKMAKFILLRVAAACEAQEGRFYSKKNYTTPGETNCTQTPSYNLQSCLFPVMRVNVNSESDLKKKSD